MELIFIIVGMGIEFFGVLILTMNANWLMKYLITKPVTYQSKTPSERVYEYMAGARRKTQGGIALFAIGFFLQIIGMPMQQIFFI